MLNLKASRVLALAGLAAAMATTGLLTTRAQGQTAAAEAPAVSPHAVMAEWSREVWDSARQGRSDQALEALSELPGVAPDAGLNGLVLSAEQWQKHIAQREELRRVRLDEVRKELVEQATAGELTKSLGSAIEWHELSLDKGAALREPEIAAVVNQAATEAREAEAAGKWLRAFDLYSYLHVLYEREGIYKRDAERMANRLTMMRLYTPRELHDMRSAARVAEGEKALPAYNGLGDDWRQKLAGINDRMVIGAMSRAAGEHVERAGWSDMMLGGLEALRTFATTTDLAAAFPNIADEQARAQFVAVIDDEIRRVNASPDRMDVLEVRRSLRRVQEADATTIRAGAEPILHEYMNGAAVELDEFTGMIWPDELAQFNRTTEGRFTGVGIQITLDKEMRLQVVTPIEGSPAQKAGVRANDVVTHINGDSTEGISLTQAVSLITGPEGSQVTLTLEREGIEEPLQFPLVRTVIPVPTIKGWRRTGLKEDAWDYFIDPENQIGYVRLTQFARGASTDMAKAIAGMRESGLQGLVLDLRYNPGGLLDEAVDIASFFVDGQQTVVTQEDATGRTTQTERTSSRRSVLRDLPVVVLVNGGSASASEIVAGCLQDYGKAVIVGDRSYGKGSVQSVYPVSGGDNNAPPAAFKLTTQYYRLPKGRLIHRRDGAATWGIEPDVRVEILPKQIGDVLEFLQDADIPHTDENGNFVCKEEFNPDRILREGMDPQLESALMLVRSKVAVDNSVKAAAAGKTGANAG